MPGNYSLDFRTTPEEHESAMSLVGADGRPSQLGSARALVEEYYHWLY